MFSLFYFYVLVKHSYFQVKRSDSGKFVRNIFAAKQKEEVGEKLSENAEWITKRFSWFFVVIENFIFWN